jgi:predicted DNA-binding transcriptional regulator AlpA
VWTWFGAGWGRGAYLDGVTDKTAGLGLEPMCSTSDLATYLGVPPQTIYDLRCAGRGPRAIRVGRELRYRASEIRACLERMEEPAALGAGVGYVR